MVGDILPRYVYWIKGENAKNIPMECLSFNRSTETFDNKEKDYVKEYYPEMKCGWSYAIQCIDPKDGQVKVLNLNVNPENPRNGFFELDWNDEFVNMLTQHGYQGDSQEEIVDRWFQTLCRTIGNEQGIDSVASGYVQINRTPDGKTEVS